MENEEKDFDEALKCIRFYMTTNISTVTTICADGSVNLNVFRGTECVFK